MVIIQTFIIAITALLGMTVITNAIKEVMVEKEKTEQRKIEFSIAATEKMSFKQIEEMRNWK
ncbi:hypothetical protein [Aerococcus urinaeequi]|uniref:hypothetical protein n=1 Tax=Aerococcus urinaeequi TaxID=51665 RepID=UPI00367080F0